MQATTHFPQLHAQSEIIHFSKAISIVNEPPQSAVLSERTSLVFIHLLKCQGSHQQLQVAA